MERMIHLVKVDFGFIDSVLQKYDCDKTRVIAIIRRSKTSINSCRRTR